jgi:uncharacterized protein involved in exopolysaccharide biosynthesis
MKRFALIAGLSFLMVGCLSGNTMTQRDEVVEELRSAVADAKHSQSIYQTQLELLDDKAEEVANTIHDQLKEQLAVLKLKVAVLEREQDKLLEEMTLVRRQAEEQTGDLAREMRGIKGVLEQVVTPPLATN